MLMEPLAYTLQGRRWLSGAGVSIPSPIILLLLSLPPQLMLPALTRVVRRLPEAPRHPGTEHLAFRLSFVGEAASEQNRLLIQPAIRTFPVSLPVSR